MSVIGKFYFEKFEHRIPYQPLIRQPIISFLFKVFGLMTIFSGLFYLCWRWIFTINPESVFFSCVLIIAETLSFIGTILMVISFWDYKDTPKKEPIHMLSEIQNLNGKPDRPVKIDVFITTYNEDPDLVRFSIRDAKKICYPFNDVPINVFVLDDGRRDGRNSCDINLKQMATEEGVHYLTRETNDGFKAGNLANGLFSTDGDLFVILDADTRTFPSILANTTGYFGDHSLAWVQTPQWFYDLTPAEPLGDYLVRLLKVNNKILRGLFSKYLSWIKVNEDIYGNDTQLFYDVILRKRNWFNATFCCGAGSIHRREAVMDFAISEFERTIDQQITGQMINVDSVSGIKKKIVDVFIGSPLTPFAHHASEDLFTSIMMHSNNKKKWRSVMHPKVECKMLSTQDIHSRTKQYQRYAEGTLDIGIKKNLLFRRGLTMGQRLCYFSTVWSYLSPLWILVFLISPIYYFFTLRSPLSSFSTSLTGLFILFQIANTCAVTLGTWGIYSVRSSQYYVSGFWFMLKALFKAMFSKQIKFNVTPKVKIKNHLLQHVTPHIIIVVLGFVGFFYNFYLYCIDQHPDQTVFLVNSIWCLFNFLPFFVLINASFYQLSSN